MNMRKFELLMLMCAVAMMAQAAQVSPEDAAIVANNFMNVATVSNGAKKAPAKRMVLKTPATQNQENKYFIYENANGEGWVLVSADDAVRPILAYSETGHFRTDNMPVNVKEWLHGYNRQITHAAKQAVPNPKALQEWARLRSGARKAPASVVVAPLIQTGWDQGGPYWNLCPTKNGEHTYTGCVATAMAQVMNYHQWPVQGTGSHSIQYNNRTYSANFGETTYDWANMLNTYESGQYNEAQETAVATLMYHCGVAIDMEYGTYDDGGSGAYTIDDNGYFSQYQHCMSVETALPMFFGYDQDSLIGYERDGWSEMGMRSFTRAEWIAMLKEELDKARPIMYAGYGYEDPTDDETMYGHSFICDGYDSDDLFHFNFGWSHFCDGYYDIDVMETSDQGAGAGNGEYNYYQNVLIGIVPPVAGDTITMNWIADGQPFDTTQTVYGRYELPAETPAACDGRVFVGWTQMPQYESATEAPEFVNEGDHVVSTTCYAVYATRQDIAAASFDGTHGGTYKIYAQEGDHRYFATGEISKGKLTSTMKEEEAADFTLEPVEGGFAIKLGDKYLKHPSGSNASNIGTQTTPFCWNIQSGTHGTWRVNSTSTQQANRALIFRAGDYEVFGGYATSNVKATGEYYDLEIATLAETIYSNYSTVCEGPQDVENISEPAPAAIKMLHNGQLFIIRGDAVYSITGTRVK